MTREEAIRELIAMKPHIDASMSVMGEVAYDMAIEALKEQRPLLEISRTVNLENPEQKKGKWIVTEKGLLVTKYECSKCKRCVIDDTGYDVAKDYPFCHCGADMRGEDNV
jgi:hypothetical protein